MIPVQNIYYMLAYAFQVLNENGYKDIATEQFDNVGELCAAILAKGISVQLKRGLGKEYVSQTEPLSSLRGKIDIAESIKAQSMLRKQLVCTYDDFTVNSYMNRILNPQWNCLFGLIFPRSGRRICENCWYSLAMWIPLMCMILTGGCNTTAITSLIGC